MRTRSVPVCPLLFGYNDNGNEYTIRQTISNKVKYVLQNYLRRIIAEMSKVIEKALLLIISEAPLPSPPGVEAVESVFPVGPPDG